MNTPADKPDLPQSVGVMYIEGDAFDVYSEAQVRKLLADERRKALDDILGFVNRERSVAGEINSRLALSRVAKHLESQIDRKEPTT